MHKNSLKGFLLLFLHISSNFPCAAQKKVAGDWVFTSEVLPCVYIPEKGVGDGFQAGLSYGLLKNKYKIQLTYGMHKYTYELSGEHVLTVNGVKQFIKKADENIFTHDAEKGLEGLPDLSKFEALEDAGFKHFIPHDGAYTTTYGTIEILRHHILGRKWDLDWGFGAQMGLMNLNMLAGGVVSNLNYPLSGNDILTSVTFRISGRYLYYGFTNRLSISRNITDRFAIGAAGGMHLLMGKKDFDLLKPYLSILARFKIK
jgi:hypothetical protein